MINIYDKSTLIVIKDKDGKSIRVSDFSMPSSRKVPENYEGQNVISEDEIVEMSRSMKFDLTDQFGIYWHFFTGKVTKKEDDSVPERKQSDLTKYFIFDKEKAQNFDYVGNTDGISVAKEVAKSDCHGMAVIYVWSTVFLPAKNYGKPYPKGSNLNLFSDIDKIAEKYGFEIDDLDNAFIRVVDKRSANRTLNIVTLTNEKFRIVLSASIEEKTEKETGNKVFLPHVEAVLYKSDKVQDFESESKVFDQLCAELNRNFNECRDNDNFDDTYKEVPEDYEFLLTIKAKEKVKPEPEAKEGGEEKPKRTRKSKKDKLAKEAADMVAQASKAMTEGALNEEESTTAAEDDGSNVDLN